MSGDAIKDTGGWFDAVSAGWCRPCPEQVARLDGRIGSERGEDRASRFRARDEQERHRDDQYPESSRAHSWQAPLVAIRHPHKKPKNGEPTERQTAHHKVIRGVRAADGIASVADQE